MENKNNKKFNIGMILWGLMLGPIEIIVIILTIKIDIPFIKAPYQESMFILAMLSIIFKIITCIIQIIIKDKIEKRGLVFYFSLISIIISWFLFWCISSEGDPNTEDTMFTSIVMTFEFVIVQLPFLLSYKDIFKDVF